MALMKLKSMKISLSRPYAPQSEQVLCPSASKMQSRGKYGGHLITTCAAVYSSFSHKSVNAEAVINQTEMINLLLFYLKQTTQPAVAAAAAINNPVDKCGGL